MLKQPIYYEFNLDARTSPSKLIAISHVDDKYSEVLEVAVKQNDRFVYMGGATVVARMVLHREKDYLLSDSVPCTVNANGNILIPFDNAVVKTSQGVVKIEVNITRDTDELTLQFPLWVSVNGSILDNAEVTPESEGTIPDLLKDAADALEDAKEALEEIASSRLTKNFKQALLNCFQNVAWINNWGQTFYQALYDALYPSENLVSISAIFTQGENVIYTTDSLDMLKQYLVVTAHYEDSSSKTITDYTLFGTLTAGTSVITVSYGGKTTTFNVTVTDNRIVIDGTSTIWELGYIAADGNITQENMQAGTYTSDFVNVGQKSQAVLALGDAEILRLAFYDSSKAFISRVLVGEADVPANAAYLRATIAKYSIGNNGYDGAGTTITLS